MGWGVDKTAPIWTSYQQAILMRNLASMSKRGIFFEIPEMKSSAAYPARTSGSAAHLADVHMPTRPLAPPLSCRARPAATPVLLQLLRPK